jgi:hypothetical protein
LLIVLNKAFFVVVAFEKMNKSNFETIQYDDDDEEKLKWSFEILFGLCEGCNKLFCFGLNHQEQILEAILNYLL